MTGQRRAPVQPVRVPWLYLGVAAAVVASPFLIPGPAPTTGVVSTAATPATAPASTAAPQLLPPEPVEVPSTVHAVQTCARIADEPTDDGVWDAALALELPPLSLPPEAAWAAVDTFVRIDCPEHAELVATTIASVTE